MKLPRKLKKKLKKLVLKGKDTAWRTKDVTIRGFSSRPKDRMYIYKAMGTPQYGNRLIHHYSLGNYN